MTAQILDGAATLTQIKVELAERVAALADRGVVPGLGTVLVGDDPGSRWYVGAKHRDCAELGIRSIRRDLPASATQAEVEAVIDELNADPECTGFLIQQPTGLDELALLSRVDPAKDVDGLHPVNLGWLVLGKPAPLPTSATSSPVPTTSTSASEFATCRCHSLPPSRGPISPHSIPRLANISTY